MQDNESLQPIEPGVPSDATTHEEIPKHTTPTWESELLLSGATVFGLLQLPTAMYAVIDRLHHQLSVTWEGVLQLGSMFSLGIVYALIATFLLHLASRAYWIALVGLRSVYPQGIRWDRVKSGPIGKGVQQDFLGDQDALIERADNRSTLIFSTGIAIVLNALTAILISVPPLVLAIILQAWVWHFSNLVYWSGFMMAIFFIPIVLPRMLDSIIGHRLAPDGASAAMLRKAMRRVAVLGPWRMAESLLLNLTSNRRGKHGFVLYLLLVWALFFGTSALENLRRKNIDLFPFHLLSQSVPARQVGDYYENAGTPSQMLPHIQSDIVTDPYLRLWVPLDPQRSQAYIHACAHPGSTTVSASDNASTACLGSVVAPKLDGHALTGLTWHPYRDPSLGVDGLRAYIPIQSLTSGEHELLLAAPARDDAEPGDKPESWRIPFWR